MNTTLVALATLAAGYALGRWQPARRASNWARWQRYGRRPTGLHYAAVWSLLSASNLAWIATHPVAARSAWRRRNDPPPPLSPPIRVRKLTEENQ